jgi:hypothetical protein
MIGETGGIPTRVNSERVYRESSSDEVKRREKDADLSRQDAFADSVSFSAEAIALAKNVPPGGEAAEGENNAAAERPPVSSGSIDLRI